MSSNLSKFGVKPAPGVGGMLQIKQPFKFRVMFFNFGGAPNSAKLTQNIVSCGRPDITHDEVALHSYNSVAYMASKPTPAAISCVVRDDLTGSVSSLIGKQMQRQQNHFEQTSAISGGDYMFRMEIQDLDGTNASPLSFWNLEGCFIKQLTHSEGDYSKTTDVQQYTLSIRFSLATLMKGNNENVITVGGNPFADVNPGSGNTGGLFG